MAAQEKKNVKKVTLKKKVISNDMLIEKYMDHVLEHGKKPESIYKFCKNLKIEEQDFYNHFGSFENLKKEIWVAFHNNAIIVLNKSADFSNYSRKEKMLSYFYTLFEVMTANRSYILFAVGEDKNPLKNLNQLKAFRLELKSFAATLIENANEEKKYKISKSPVSLSSEGAWLQFLFLLKYWMEDNSAGFEKTDIAIEKSVNAIFEVFESTPLDSVIDFGKFLFQDRFKQKS